MTPAPPADEPPPSSWAVYSISVAARLVGCNPQNLRLYEARGLITPERSEGGTRHYSGDDLSRIRRIGELLEAGLNLAGIAMVLELQAANHALQAQLDERTPQVPSRQRRRPVPRD